MTTSKMLTDVDEIFKKDMQDENFRLGVQSEINKLSSAVSIKKERENYGWTQKELAQKAGLPQSTIARIENGSNTSMDTISKIANAFGKKVVLNFE